MKIDLYKEIPSVDVLLRTEEIGALTESFSRAFVTEALRVVVSSIRDEIAAGASELPSTSEIANRAARWIERELRPGLSRVINASGTILHTNLGRAVLSAEAIEALVEAASGTVDLEFDTSTGARGERDARVEELLIKLTGAEAACVVNNNAAAVLIALNTLAEAREVVISRGELVEIGGGFRLPDIIKKSGCVLKEVGTTNRTHPADYSDGVTDETALILKAHTSNYTIKGFTSEVGLKELASIAKEKGLPLMEDLGSGSLVDMTAFGLGSEMREPVVGESVGAGVDVVTFSGDKLLGGPQAGLIVGKSDLVERIKKNPLKRALRADKLTLAALEATLKLYLNNDTLASKLPTLSYLTRPPGEIEALAKEASSLIMKKLGADYTVEVEEGRTQAGSGALPVETFLSWTVTITHPDIKAAEIFKSFLTATPHILGRVNREKFILDMRAVEEARLVVPNFSGGDA